MSTSLVTEIFGLGSIIGLPTLAKGVIHSIVSKVIIFEIKVVEVVAAWFNFLSLENTDKLTFSSLERDCDLLVFI
jgi:hypothetical protein